MNSQESKEIQIPQTLDQAVAHVKEKIAKFVKEEFAKGKNENEIANSMHFGLGKFIRNHWGLWSGDSLLFKELSSLGLFHADDMSSLVLKCAVLDLNNKDRDVSGIVNHYREYWKNVNTKKN